MKKSAGQIDPPPPVRDRVKRRDKDLEIDLKKEEPIKNRFGETAARIFVTRYPQNLNPEDGEGLLTKGMRYIRGSSQPRKQEKVLMLLGLRGSECLDKLHI